MINYTKKNLDMVTLMLAILTFICVYLISSIVSLFSSYNNSNIVYSKKIPIKFKNTDIQTITLTGNISDTFVNYVGISKSDSLIEKEMTKIENAQKELKQEYKTQRQVLEANKQSKWRVQIPKLGLDVHIKEGTTQSVLLQSVGHFENTSTWNGNIALAGHNRGYLCNFFENIKKLKVGDEIIYLTKQGKRIYKVQTNKVILGTDWSYIEETKDNRITLITCEENRSDYRRCVQAVQVVEWQNKI